MLFRSGANDFCGSVNGARPIGVGSIPWKMHVMVGLPATATRDGAGRSASISRIVPSSVERISARCAQDALIREMTLSPKVACGLNLDEWATTLPPRSAAATIVVVPIRAGQWKDRSGL